MDDVRFSEVTYAPAYWAVVPALALIALVTLIVLHERTARSAHKHVKASALAWALPHALLLGAATLWYATGAGSPSIPSLIVFCLACVFAAYAALRRDDRSLPVQLTLPITVLCGVLSLEFCCNAKFFTIGPVFWLVEAALVGGLTCGLWLLTGRRGIGPAISLTALTLVGIAQHYVLEFRGTAILPSDIFALGTALSVSGGYTYDLSAGMLWGLSTFSVGLCCASLIRREASATSLIRPVEVAAGALALLLTGMLATLPSYGNVFGAQIDYWWSKDWYERQGFLPSFIFAWQDMGVRMPEGYTPDAAKATQASLAQQHTGSKRTFERRAASSEQFSHRPPNIIVVQNETFCDLSTFDHLRNGYFGPEFWNNGMPDALARGSLAVSVFGGGTCNTEFEFLTGNSLAFLGTAKYPFTMYDLSNVQSLPRQLSACAYHTVGMHPNIASNWNRDRAYAQLGFDEFLDEAAFQGAEQYHTHTSDWATYNKALDLIRTHDDPVFVFDVTMQNHSGYDTGSIPPDQLRNYTIDGLSAEDTFELNEFLACIDESDRALKRLVETLKATDEPTIVVMYGDHHPWFSAAVNDLLFPNEDELAHGERIHNTSYIVWANYKVAGGVDDVADGGDTSADMLAAMLLDAIGAPTSEFQQALLGTRQQIRAINADGYLGADGVWRPLDDATHGLSLVEYLNFGSTV